MQVRAVVLSRSLVRRVDGAASSVDGVGYAC